MICFLIIVCEIQERVVVWDEDNFTNRLLEFMVTFASFLYFISFVFYLYNYIKIEFVQEIEDICLPLFALNFATFYFFAYLLFVVMFLFIIFVAFCAYLAMEQQAANMQREMKHIFEKIYLDPEAIKNFYLRYGE